MLVDRDALLRALDLVQEEDFYQETHRRIFTTMKDLHDQHVEVDLITVGDALRQAEALTDVGGQSYLISITNVLPTSHHLEHYAKIVRKNSLQREVIATARHAIAQAHDGGKTADELLDEIQAKFLSLSEKGRGKSMTPASELMHSAVELLEQLASNGKYVTGVPSGFTDLDNLTSGFQPGNLIIVAGRPSMGKTTICLNMAENLSILNKRAVVFFSLEMSQQEMGMRLLCSQAKINLRDLRRGILARRNWPQITTAASKISEAPLYFDFTTSSSIMELRSSARRWSYSLAREGTPLATIFIDYLQLMHAPGVENRQQEISLISRSLKALARELNIPVIALSQLNRRPEEKGREGRPQLSDLRESGALEQDADVVMALFREEIYRRDDPDLKGKAKLFILKQRNGPIGDITLTFLEEFTRFETMSKEEI